eukprot:TRINITY_DN57447_c0_g1_i1.p1 TRINITY_DN57447_c0_g1~~TRINITY_DN57447_c0_g1_i1.p1  ORF type:complete len:122 (+),score=14.53 TRINITY_DN57447_c0_g1_i1:126-491(+)
MYALLFLCLLRWGASNKRCFDGGFTEEYCCRGRKGRADCWDSLHTYESCCQEYKNKTYPFNDLLWGKREASVLDPRQHPPRGELWDAHLRCILEMQTTGSWQEQACALFENKFDTNDYKGR